MLAMGSLSLLSSGYRGPRTLPPGVKRPGREVDNSPPSNVEVKKMWSYTSISSYVFMAWCLVKHRKNFVFLYTNNVLDDINLTSSVGSLAQEGKKGDVMFSVLSKR
jgi:hypothetical protein